MQTMPVYYYLNPILQHNVITKYNLKNADNKNYLIYNYDKNYLCYNDHNNGLYRSVIYSYPESTILSYSPPKTIDVTNFMQKYPSIGNDNILVNEMIAGIMIQLFYDVRLNQWQIATKGAVGCKYYHREKGETFSSTKKTFYRMFLDALTAMPDQELKDVALLDLFPKNAAYTFILQHPENNIIIPNVIAKLYLVAVYKLMPTMNCVEFVSPTVYENWQEFQNIQGTNN